ncbi:DNA polymerase III subunit beta [Mycoplasma procyoni]|uniref:DNA polymerase III subunit beta n=1 Tax=Mycoplasma procyoni TaxID=568784 RepID=UPI00197B7A1C|nr:DNA polymerase III subunit beta [Mycoplasma procyoni]MBN3534805.1 DNA polymerase III subunit beta [Mycoplasma procyoni]
MNFKIDKKNLEKDFDRIAIAIDSTNLTVNLRGIFLQLKEEGLYLIGSNGEISIKSFISAENLTEIKKTGISLINYSLLKNIIKKTNGIIEFDFSSDILTIKNNEDVYTLNLMEAEDYPQIQFDGFGDKMVVSADDLRKAIKNTIFAAATDNPEVILNSLNLAAYGGYLTISATDRYRMAVEKVELNGKPDFNVSILAKSIKDFIPSDLHGEVEIFVTEYKVETKIENTLIQCKLIGYPYKDISAAFPSGEELVYQIEIDKKEFSDLISKASIISSDSYYKLILSVDNEEFSLSGERKEMGNVKVKTRNHKFKGPEESLTIALNHKYLKDAISVFEGNVHIYVNKARTKVLILSPSCPSNKQLMGTT